MNRSIRGPAIGSLVEINVPEDAELEASGRVLVAPNEGQSEVVNVEGLWPGEAGQVRILARSRHKALLFGRAVNRHREHAGRQDAPCMHHPDRISGALARDNTHLEPDTNQNDQSSHQNHGKARACGGCPWMTLNIETQRELKLRVLRDVFAKLLPSASPQDSTTLPQTMLSTMQGPPAPALGYRYVAKRVAGLHRGRIVLGSYQPQSHRVASMEHCQVDLPLIQQLFARCQELLRSHRVRVYEEQKQSGELRYLWAKSDGLRVHLTVLGATPRSEALNAAIAGLVESFGAALTVSWAQHDQTSNVLRPQQVPEVIVAGDTLPSIEVLGQRVELDALSFIQANPSVAQACYDALLSDKMGQRLRGELALDLYAGAGATTTALSQSFNEVMACEQSPPPGADPRVRAQRAEDFLQDLSAKDIQLVIANPPRAGLRNAVCEALVKLSPERIHIMSCGPQGLRRDLEALCAQGYILSSLLAFDPLPHTAHVEVVARLKRPNEA